MYALDVSRVALACALTLASACTTPDAEGDQTDGEMAESGEGGEFASLIDHQEWQVLDAAADPLADHRPELIDCGPAGWLIEENTYEGQTSYTLEVQTNYCNYAALGQPSLRALEEGQMVQVIFYHFDLVAPEPTTGHVAILIDGQVLWEQEIAIPGDANVFTEEFESPISAELGSPVVFHLHNHGQNTWALQDLQAMP